jgi:phospholipid transport system substrate-binding protein
MKALRVTTVLAVVAAVGLVSTPVIAGPPTDQMKAYTEAVLKILEDPALKADDKKHERRAAVRKVATEVFDVEETAKRALGRHWPGRSPEERKEFVDLFADLLERTYISKIDLYGGERLRFTNEKIDGDNAVVRAMVQTKRGAEVPVEARMQKRGDRWLMYDVLLENISLVGNYRAQFDQIVRSNSYAELVKRLRDKKFEGDAAAKPRPASR